MNSFNALLSSAKRDPKVLSVPEELSRYQERLKELSRPSWHVVTSTVYSLAMTAEVVRTVFGSIESDGSIDDLPICSSCQNSMSFAFQVDFSEIPPTPQIPAKGLFRLFLCRQCCWQFKTSWNPDWSPVESTQDYEEGERKRAVIYRWNSLPSICSDGFAEIIGDESFFGTEDAYNGDNARLYSESFIDVTWATQIGGYPPWIEQDYYNETISTEDATRCPCCSEPAKFLLAVGTESGALFEGDGYVLVFYCQQTPLCGNLDNPIVFEMSWQ